jgi:hypothetical protein
LISWVLFVLILTAITVIIYFIFKATVHSVELAVDTTATIIIFIYLVAVVIFNKFVLTLIIHKLVDFEMNATGANYQASFMLKYSLGLFFTTGILTLIVEGALNTNVFHEKFGIVEEETIMFFFATLLVNLIWLVNPWYLWKVFQRKWHQDSPYITQE